MTLTTSQAAVVYQGDGNNTSFPFSFPVTDASQAVVTITDTTQTPNVVTTLTPGTQFVISPMHCPNGGTVTYPYPTGNPLAVGFHLTIRRIVPYEQSTSIINQGGFYPEVLEGALDYLTMQTQQLAEQASRAVQVPVGSGIDPTAYLNGVQSNIETLTNQAAASAGSAASSAIDAAQSATTAQSYVQSLSGSSSTPMTIAPGAQSLTTRTGLNLVIGQFITLAATTAPANYMHGQITSYNPTTGALTATITDIGGGGTFSGWTLSLSGSQGPQGVIGPAGSVIAVSAGAGLSGGTITATGTLSIASNGVSNSMLALAPAMTVKANSSTAAASPGDVSISSLGNLITPSLNIFGSGSQGAVPASGGGTANFLRADGNWVQPLGIPYRQTVFAGDVDANNKANFLTVGNGLTPAYTVNSGQLLMAFAAGFGANGAVDLLSRLTTSGTLASVPANQTSFLFATYSSPSSVTWGSTPVPPHYGQVFDPMGYGLYHLENSGADDYGNAPAVNSGGAFSTAQARFGSYAWCNTSSSATLTLASGPKTTQAWTIEFFHYVPATGQQGLIFCTSLNSYAMQFGESAGAYAFNVSSAGGSWDVVNAATGAALTVGWHHVAITWDGSYYRTFRDGILDSCTASTTPPWTGGPGLIFGYYSGARQGALPAGQYFDELRISPCVRYPTGSTTTGTVIFTSPSTAFAADGDFFNTAAMQMTSISGAGPSFTPVQRVYVGECVAGISTITGITTYALLGQFTPAWTTGLPGTNTTVSCIHNLGTQAFDAVVEIKNLVAEYGFQPGDIYANPTGTNGPGAQMSTMSCARRRNTALFGTGNVNWLILSINGTNVEYPTAANWAYRVVCKRRF